MKNKSDATEPFAPVTGSVDRPHCGKCGKTMTPENSTGAPEYFLCDGCAIAGGFKPRQPFAVESTSRHVIERKLLTALEDGNTVAILASEEDLKLLIFALSQCSSPKAMPMARDFGQLLAEAFPPNAALSDSAAKPKETL